MLDIKRLYINKFLFYFVKMVVFLEMCGFINNFIMLNEFIMEYMCYYIL